jgi:protein TonB
VHAALIGWLPSPFHHDHSWVSELQVELARSETPPQPVKPPQPEPLLEPAVSRPPVPATSSKPERVTSPKPVVESKPSRAPAAPATPAAPEPDRLLTHVEPDKAIASVPVASESADTKEKSATASAQVARSASGDAGPEVPPSFRAGYLRNPEPPYPPVSRRLGEQGTVQLRVQVSPEGRAARVEVQRSSGFPRLDEAAAAAVREWRFVPARRGDAPIEAAVIVPIVFRLEAE